MRQNTDQNCARKTEPALAATMGQGKGGYRGHRGISQRPPRCGDQRVYVRRTDDFPRNTTQTIAVQGPIRRLET